MARQTREKAQLAGSLLLAVCLSRPSPALPAAAAQAAPAESNNSGPAFTPLASSFLGIYESVPVPETIPGAEPASPPTLDSLPLTPEASKAPKPSIDPRNACQVLGPFRMMATPDVHFEILRDAPDKFVFLFERSSWGHVRTIGIDAEHLKDFSKVRPMWNGDSVAAWDGDTLVIDSLHFTSRTWLNEAGVVNSKQLHLTERLHLLDGGEYLQYRATATDPAVLAAPVSYTRYFKRTTREITAYNCYEHRPAKAGP